MDIKHVYELKAYRYDPVTGTEDTPFDSKIVKTGSEYPTTYAKNSLKKWIDRMPGYVVGDIEYLGPIEHRPGKPQLVTLEARLNKIFGKGLK